MADATWRGASLRFWRRPILPSKSSWWTTPPRMVRWSWWPGGFPRSGSFETRGTWASRRAATSASAPPRASAWPPSTMTPRPTPAGWRSWWRPCRVRRWWGWPPRRCSSPTGQRSSTPRASAWIRRASPGTGGAENGTPPRNLAQSRSSGPALGRPSTAGRCWTRSASSMRTSSAIWRMWTWPGGPGSWAGAACTSPRLGSITSIRARGRRGLPSRTIFWAGTRSGPSSRTIHPPSSFSSCPSSLPMTWARSPTPSWPEGTPVPCEVGLRRWAVSPTSGRSGGRCRGGARSPSLPWRSTSAPWRALWRCCGAIGI